MVDGGCGLRLCDALGFWGGVIFESRNVTNCSQHAGETKDAGDEMVSRDTNPFRAVIR